LYYSQRKVKRGAVHDGRIALHGSVHAEIGAVAGVRVAAVLQPDDGGLAGVHGGSAIAQDVRSAQARLLDHPLVLGLVDAVPSP